MGAFTFQVASVSINPVVTGSTEVELLAGQTLALSALRGASVSSFALSGAADGNYVIITKVG